MKVINVIILAVIFVLFSSSCLPSPEIQPATTTTSETEAQVIGEWSGSGDKNTEPFTISKSPWTIEWEKHPTSQTESLLQVFIYRPNADLWLDYVQSGTGINFETDTGYIYKTGTFYLNISGLSCSWKVRVVGIP
jgi:hypothetical protein